jgi:hypothetical protein
MDKTPQKYNWLDIGPPICPFHRSSQKTIIQVCYDAFIVVRLLNYDMKNRKVNRLEPGFNLFCFRCYCYCWNHETDNFQKVHVMKIINN